MMGSSAVLAFLLCLPGADDPAPPDPAADLAAADEKLLQDQKIGTDSAALLAFLRRLTPSPGDQKRFADLILQLGDDSYEARQTASMELRRSGSSALSLLREATRHSDPEVARRAKECVDAIEAGPGPSATMAACRRLARLAPDGAVETLLGLAPFADDSAVEDDICAALLALTPSGRPSAAVLAALGDSQVGRRAAAAFVAGRADDLAIRDRAARLLVDREPLVRFRAAEGLLAGRDRRSVPVLVALLADGPEPLAWRAEEFLLRLAGEKAPQISIGTGSTEERRKWRDTWAAWWQTNGDKIDLKLVSEASPYLRQILIPEMHNGRIVEFGPSGTPLWQLKNTNQPRDAQVLPGGRVLVCECGNGGGRVAEYEIRSGTLLWQQAVHDPAYAQRLPNGNTFIATHQDCCEVTRDGKEIYRHTAEQGFFIHSTHRKANGNIVWLSMAGHLREMTPDGKIVCKIEMLPGPNGNWCGVEGLRDGHYLVVELNQGRVIEVDNKGREIWKCQIDGASYANRLPTGNTLVCSFNGQRVVEVDPKGTVVREIKLTASPWRAHAR